MKHNIIQLAHEFAVLEGLSQAQVSRFAKQIAKYAREEAAKKCFERSDKWHLRYWEAIGERDIKSAVFYGALRDEAAMCKRIIRECR